MRVSLKSLPTNSGKATPGMMWAVIGRCRSPIFVIIHNDLYDTMSISCTSVYALLTTGFLPLFSFKKCLSDSSPIILVHNLSSYNVTFPGLLEWFTQIKSNRDSPTVGPSIGELELGLGLAIDNFIISSEAEDDLVLRDDLLSDSSDDILSEKKKIKFSIYKGQNISLIVR